MRKQYIPNSYNNLETRMTCVYMATIDGMIWPSCKLPVIAVGSKVVNLLKALTKRVWCWRLQHTLGNLGFLPKWWNYTLKPKKWTQEYTHWRDLNCLDQQKEIWICPIGPNTNLIAQTKSTTQSLDQTQNPRGAILRSWSSCKLRIGPHYTCVGVGMPIIPMARCSVVLFVHKKMSGFAYKHKDIHARQSQ